MNEQRLQEHEAAFCECSKVPGFECNGCHRRALAAEVRRLRQTELEHIGRLKLHMEEVVLARRERDNAVSREIAAGREKDELRRQRDHLQQELNIVKLAVPLEDELAARIDEMYKYLAMEQGFTLSGIARLLTDVQRRMAADWSEIGRERRERLRLQEERP